MITKEQILLAYSIFLFTVVQLSAMAGSTLVGNVPGITAPSPPTSLLDIPALFSWIGGNILFFFDMMRVSTSYTAFGAIIITPFLILLIYIIADLLIRIIRALRPF
jgi:hypothetical protein